MILSRRNFLLSATAIGPWFPQLARVDTRDAATDCVLLDLQSHCVLRESLQGYAAALPATRINALRLNRNSPRRRRIVIVAGAAGLDKSLANSLSDLLQNGTKVLLECGAAFCSPSEFASQRELLHWCFGLEIDPPVSLWPATRCTSNDRCRLKGRAIIDAPQPVPYIQYLWPSEATVRDFSRLVPVRERVGDVIGRSRGLPAASKIRVGKGLLIFLGSPLGPALRAGDRQAHSWLRQLISA